MEMKTENTENTENTESHTDTTPFAAANSPLYYGPTPNADKYHWVKTPEQISVCGMIDSPFSVQRTEKKQRKEETPEPSTLLLTLRHDIGAGEFVYHAQYLV